ncbi:MAG: helix-turn-helix domain-containing protein [Clostridia bacterium]|nr:helix-turn-helix domain-containing protein [Clostridia bacterium]
MAFIEVEKKIYENEWAMHDLHSHPHYEFYFLTKGSRSFFLSNALYKLAAPAIVIIPPHVMHKTEGGAFERYNINVSEGYLDDFEKETFGKRALQVIKPKPTEEAELLKLLALLEETDRRQKYGESVLNKLFSYFVLTVSKISDAHLFPHRETKNSIPPLILKVIDYVNEHYSESQTLDDIAKAFFVSRSTLIYNFKKYTNCSLIDFVLNVRLTKAKELLLNTKKSVGEISELCGFSSSNYFGLIFKKKENLSPANYRKHQNTKT